jgi:hypothetical protein
MGGSNGGTRKWCPNCREITVCAAINPKDVYDGVSRMQRVYWSEHRDLNAFRRGILCLVCHESWLTVEIEEDLMDELIDLREKLTELKLHASAYETESLKAATSLKKLTESISILKALN